MLHNEVGISQCYAGQLATPIAVRQAEFFYLQETHLTNLTTCPIMPCVLIPHIMTSRISQSNIANFSKPKQTYS